MAGLASIVHADACAALREFEGDRKPDDTGTDDDDVAD